MIRTIICCGLVFILFETEGCATDKPAPARDFTIQRPTTQTANTSVDKVLNPDMEWVSPNQLDQDFRAVNEPFEKVIKRLGDEVLSNFKCDHAALTAAGVKIDTPISVYVKRAKAGKALDAILKYASAKTPGKPALGYFISGYNTVSITTERELYSRWVYTREYSIVDLLIDPDQERVDALLLLLKETIAPTSWTTEGGKCAMKYANGVLTVTQTHENLELLDSTLQQLRETNPSPLESRLHPQGLWRKIKDPATKENQ